jgi:putative SOS response-associated peptidase YedK
MCGRFTASFGFREIKLLFNLQRDIPLLIPRYNIAPSQEVPVIVQNDGVNELKPMKWGLVPSWAPDPSIGNNMINARAETITEKPSYRRLIESKRCLIPADGFYEWRREGNGKIPVWFHLKKTTVCLCGSLGYVAGCRRRGAPQLHNHNNCTQCFAATHSQPYACDL